MRPSFCLLLFALPVSGQIIVVQASPPIVIQQAAPPVVLVAKQMPPRIVKTVTYTVVPAQVVYVAATPRKGFLARLKDKLVGGCCGGSE